MSDATTAQRGDDPVRRILDHAAAVKADAERIDTSRTEEVVAGALSVGDVITALGNVEFPFPFTITWVQRHERYGNVSLRAAHGWFTMRPANLDDRCVRVLAAGNAR